LGAVVAYLLLADLLGFVITMASLLTVLMVKLGTRLRVAVPAALATAAVILVLFGQVLLVPLPPGPFGPIG
ncbi:MAG: tripartite tricarboxylate transporter TctB family protein, partial [Streptomycetales bacterium]